MSVSLDEMKQVLTAMGEKAVTASRALAVLDSQAKNAILNRMADAVEAAAPAIMTANAQDLEGGRAAGLSNAMLDRLRLDSKRIKDMANGLREVAQLPDPVGKVLDVTARPNGLRIEKVSVPIGVIGIIYESRPNVTVDSAGLCLKAGNAVILRGGSEAFHSNQVLADCLNQAGIAAGLPDGAVQLVQWTDRQAVSVLLKMDQYIDLIIPRGGEGLIRAVVEQSTIPVIKHYKGVCHLYVDADCDQAMALEVISNAKYQRPGTCNALETVLIDVAIAAEFVPKFMAEMKKLGIEVRGDERFRQLAPEAKPATDDDFYTEYLDLILSVKVVDTPAEAIAHINKYGSGHSDGILTNNRDRAARFMLEVDSAAVYHNASTRFTDGNEFGMGAEIGISTDKLHARGPMGLPELTSYKYLVFGSGQIRG